MLLMCTVKSAYLLEFCKHSCTIVSNIPWSKNTCTVHRKSPVAHLHISQFYPGYTKLKATKKLIQLDSNIWQWQLCWKGAFLLPKTHMINYSRYRQSHNNDIIVELNLHYLKTRLAFCAHLIIFCSFREKYFCTIKYKAPN